MDIGPVVRIVEIPKRQHTSAPSRDPRELPTRVPATPEPAHEPVPAPVPASP
jgi:hypothetical protein